MPEVTTRAGGDARRNLAAHLEALQSARTHLDQLIEGTHAHLSGLGDSPSDMIEFVEGREAVRVRLDEIAFGCQEEVCLLSPVGPPTEEQAQAARGADADVFARGVRVRAIVGEAARKYPRVMEHVQEDVERGAQYRVLPALPTQLIVVDRRVAYVRTAQRLDSAYIVTSPVMVELFVRLFEELWASAWPLLTQVEGPQEGPSPQEVAALRGWVRGMTDAQVAKAMGVSERTVRRLGEVISERLDATSRFELGTKAALAGWLTKDDVV